MGKSISFHGHKITSDGILPDASKVEAILNMQKPEDVTGIRRLCGLVQFMARFLPNLADSMEPLRNLTRKATEWNWTDKCEQAFQKVKKHLTEAPILAYFDSSKEIVLQVDSSIDGLGAVLLQNGKLVEYASQSLTDAERKWAQIEIEALAVLYGLEKFDQYTYGRKVNVQNDHKPLENILRKPLSQAPKRLQDILMKLFRYDFNFQYMKGSELVIADTLSRAFTETRGEGMRESRPRILSVGILDEFPDERITELQSATNDDCFLCQLREIIQEGWPEKDNLTYELKPYYSLRDTLSTESGLILRGEAVLIPKALRKKMLEKLHSSHLGYQSLCRRAKGTIFCIGMYNDIKEIVNHCEQCEILKPRNSKEPLQQHSDWKRPWDKIGTDLFVLQNRNYLLVIDYFTNFIEIDYLPSTVVEKLKKQFCRFGIPRQIVSDGGPQYTSSEFQKCVKQWGILHHITSPAHPNSNGKAESGVKIMKSLMRKCAESGTDQYEAFLEQRNTPRQDTGLSPAKMMFGWEARTMLPSFQPVVRPSDKRLSRKVTVKRCYDKNAKQLPELAKDQPVFFQHKSNTNWQKGKIVCGDERNYKVQAENGAKYDRNRVHIRPTAIPFFSRDASPTPSSTPASQLLRATPPPMPHNADPRASTPDLVQPDILPVPLQEDQQSREQIIPTLRPKRNMRPPAYLKDYVTN